MTARDQQRARVLTRILKGELTMADGRAELGLSERQLWRLRRALVESDRPAWSTATEGGHRRGASGPTGEPGSSSCASGTARSTTPTSASSWPNARGSPSAARACAPSCAPRASPARVGDARRAIAAGDRGWAPRARFCSSTAAVIAGSASAVPSSSSSAPSTLPPGWSRPLSSATRRTPPATSRSCAPPSEAHGLPGAIYRDGHSAFAPSKPARHPLADDEPALSQVGRALVELDIDSILAGSPQAKGRVERLWGTFQDRLVVELRLARVVDRDGANAFLGGYLARHNARFVVPALDPAAAWRALPDDVRLDRILVFKYRRKVARDHTITLAGRVLQLPRGATGAANYAGKRVEVHVGLDGSMVAYDGARRLAVAVAPPDPGQLRAADAPRAAPGLVPAEATIPWIPPRTHPWKRVTPGSKLEKRLTGSLGS